MTLKSYNNDSGCKKVGFRLGENGLRSIKKNFGLGYPLKISFNFLKN